MDFDDFDALVKTTFAGLTLILALLGFRHSKKAYLAKKMQDERKSYFEAVVEPVYLDASLAVSDLIEMFTDVILSKKKALQSMDAESYTSQFAGIINRYEKQRAKQAHIRDKISGMCLSIRENHANDSDVIEFCQQIEYIFTDLECDAEYEFSVRASSSQSLSDVLEAARGFCTQLPKSDEERGEYVRSRLNEYLSPDIKDLEEAVRRMREAWKQTSKNYMDLKPRLGAS